MANVCVLSGNLTRDPEVRPLSNGDSLVSFGIAVNDNFSKEKKAHFFDCKAFGKQADFISEYFTKGKPIQLVCRATLEQWESDGQKRSKVVFVVERAEFWGPKPADDSAPKQTASPKKAKATKQTASQNDDDNGPPDESIPF